MPDPQPNQFSLPGGGLIGSVVGAVVQRGGIFGTIGVAGMFLYGLSDVLSGLGFLHINPVITSGLLWIAWSMIGLCLVSVGWHAKRQNQMTATVAAKAEIDRSAILNAVTPPNIAVVPSSTDPAVASEIKKQVTASGMTALSPAAVAAIRATPPVGTAVAAVDPQLAALTAEVKGNLQDFDLSKITGDKLIEIVTTAAKTLGLGDRIGSGIWFNLLTGNKDTGAVLELYEKQNISLDALIGHATAGAAIGYDFAHKGNFAASVFGGATHPYSGLLTAGWSPVLGVSIRF